MSDISLPRMSSSHRRYCRLSNSEYRSSFTRRQRRRTNLFDQLIVQFRNWRASDVLGVRNWFQVIGIHTSRIATQMIQFQSFRNWALVMFVHRTMSGIALSANRDVTMSSLAILGTKPPNPTTGIESKISLNPEIGRDRITACCHTSTVALNEAEVLPLLDAIRRISALCDTSDSSAPALAIHRASVSQGGGS